MRDHASNNANGNFTKSTVVKAGSTFTSPKMVIDLQSTLSLPNRPRIVSLEFHSSPRQLPRMPLLPRNLSKKLFDEHQAGTPDIYSMDMYAMQPVKEIDLPIRPKVLGTCALQVLGLSPSPLSPLASCNANAELPLSPRTARPNNDEMCLTPASSSERNIWMPGPPVLECEDSRILHSPTMPRELFIPDDF